MLLTQRQYTAIRLRRKNGYTDTQVARQMGIRRESANRLIARANRRLLRLRRQCSSPADCALVAGILN